MSEKCYSCRHWCNGVNEGLTMRDAYTENGWSASCSNWPEMRSMLTIEVRGDGCVDSTELDTPPDFGCTFHEPIERAR